MILALNAGSSSVKFALFEAADPGVARLRGQIEELDEAPHLLARSADGRVVADQRWPAGAGRDFAALVERLLALIESDLGADLAAVGHRVVHGGPHVAPLRITPDTLAALDALIPLAPLHMPHNLAPIRAIAAARPGLPQIACFDTAFHDTMPPVARNLGLPRALADSGLRRYGFHGLSYEYIAGQLAELSPPHAGGRVIVAHLGSGASLCAMQNGCSIATTMGFSALDGLVMATRCGRLDPGVILYLARQGHSVGDIEDLLYHRSGLLGVSGISGDIRVLLASADAPAREAIELFTYRVAAEAAGLVSALGGLDQIVFTGGIGEHSAPVRREICGRLGWLGIRLDDAANLAGASRISTPDSAIATFVIPTDEEATIARHTWRILGTAAADPKAKGSAPGPRWRQGLQTSTN